MIAPKMSIKFLIVAVFSALILYPDHSAHAQKELTIAAPGYEKTITLDEDPELIISYTPNGMKIDFANINMKVVCIEDPSTDGLCRLQAYDGSTGGPVGGVPPSPSKPTATAGDGQVALTWTAPAENGSAIVGYKIDQTSPSTTTIISNTNSVATSYTVTGLTNGTPYSFAVAAINGTGLGYMSPSSDAVTPQTSGGGGGSDVYAACNSVPANVTCFVVGEGNLDNGGYREISIDSGKTLTVPFDLAASEGTDGNFRFNSFYNVNGTFANSFFETWLSTSPAGSTDLNGVTAGAGGSSCFKSRQYAEFTFAWNRGASPGSSGCYIGTSTATGIVYLNMRFRDGITGVLRAYGVTSFYVE